MFADASGFTRLSELLTRSPKLGEKKGALLPVVRFCAFVPLPAGLNPIPALPGRAGAEKLCTIMNDFFAKIIDITEAFGGDIVKVQPLIGFWSLAAPPPHAAGREME